VKALYVHTMSVDALEKSLNYSLKPRDCADMYNNGERTDGLYTVYANASCIQCPVQVFCDMTADGGGWTVCITSLHTKRKFYDQQLHNLLVQNAFMATCLHEV